MGANKSCCWGCSRWCWGSWSSTSRAPFYIMWQSTTRVTSRKGQEALITWRRALEDMEISCHHHISSCLNRLCILAAKQAELTIHWPSLPPASIKAEVPSLDGSLFHREPLLHMVPSAYPVGTVSTLPLVSDSVPPSPVPIIKENPTMQQEVKNQLCLHYMGAKICLMVILAPGEEIICQLGATFN